MVDLEVYQRVVVNIQFYDVMSSRRRRLARQALKAASAEGGKR